MNTEPSKLDRNLEEQTDTRFLTIKEVEWYGVGSHPLVNGIPPNWATGWGQYPYGVFVESGDLRFWWHQSGFWFCEVEPGTAKDISTAQLKTIGASYETDPEVIANIQGSVPYRGFTAAQARQKAQEILYAEQAAALKKNMAENPEKYAAARRKMEEEQRRMEEEMKSKDPEMYEMHRQVRQGKR